MKKVICILFLLMGLFMIGSVTVYTLSHKEVKGEVEEQASKKIEEVASNLSGNNLQEIYNIYIDNEKHKLKLVYYINMLEEGNANIELMVYFDNVSIIEEKVGTNIVGENIDEIVSNKDFTNYIKLNDKNITIKKFNKKEYIMLNIGYYNDNEHKEMYYIFNEKGKLLNKDGFLIIDDSKYYVSLEKQELDIFYDNNEQIYTKIEGDNIYTLVPSVKKDAIKIKEYKYVVKNGKLEKELLNTYDVLEKEEDLQVSQID